MKTGLLVPILLLIFWPGALRAADPAADGAAARTVVDSFHQALLESMQNAEALGFQGRFDRIDASLAETFDLPFMARVAIGVTWKELEPQQRADFVDLSRRLSASRYADNFDGYSGQDFETLSQEPSARGTIVVKTALSQLKDDDVRFDYRLRKVGSDWRVIDILLDGKISELVLLRNQYRAVIDDEGYAALVEAIEEKIDDHAAD